MKNEIINGLFIERVSSVILPLKELASVKLNTNF